MWAGVDIGVGVEGVAIVADLAVAGVEVAGGRLIDEVVPIAVERGDGPMVDADEKRSQRLLRAGAVRVKAQQASGMIPLRTMLRSSSRLSKNGGIGPRPDNLTALAAWRDDSAKRTGEAGMPPILKRVGLTNLPNSG